MTPDLHDAIVMTIAAKATPDWKPPAGFDPYGASQALARIRIKLPRIDFDAVHRGCPKAVASLNAARAELGLRPLTRKDLGLKPHSGRWRRPKVWRARDILEARAYQGKGFRGTVQAAELGRRGQENYLRDQAEKLEKNRGFVAEFRRAKCELEDARYREGLGRLDIAIGPNRANGLQVATEALNELWFPMEVLRERFWSQLPDPITPREWHSAEDVEYAIQAAGGLEFEPTRCERCGAPTTRGLTALGFPMRLGLCGLCRHGKPKTTLPKRAAAEAALARAIEEAKRTPFDLAELERINRESEARG